MSNPEHKLRDVSLTARQRGELARLRIMHPRAAVTVLSRQDRMPTVRVRMQWPRARVNVWLDPQGQRVELASASRHA